MTKCKYLLFALVAGCMLTACSEANFSTLTAGSADTITTQDAVVIHATDVLPTAGSATIMKQDDTQSVETVNGVQEIQDDSSTVSTLSVDGESGTICNGNKYYLEPAYYNFSIKPEYQFAVIHVYDINTDKEVLSHTLVINEDEGVNNDEVEMEIPDDTYIVVSTKVDYQKV